MFPASNWPAPQMFKHKVSDGVSDGVYPNLLRVPLSFLPKPILYQKWWDHHFTKIEFPWISIIQLTAQLIASRSIPPLTIPAWTTVICHISMSHMGLSIEHSKKFTKYVVLFDVFGFHHLLSFSLKFNYPVWGDLYSQYHPHVPHQRSRLGCSWTSSCVSDRLTGWYQGMCIPLAIRGW